MIERLPGSGHTEIVIAVVIPVVVDVQPVSIEVANVDSVTVRIHLLPVSIRITGN